MWYTRNKFYSEIAEENLQEAKIACDAESPSTYNIDINSQIKQVISNMGVNLAIKVILGTLTFAKSIQILIIDLLLLFLA